MRKYIIIIAFLLIFAAGMFCWALTASATVVTFSADTTINMWNSGQTWIAESGSTAAGLSVYGTYITVTLEDGSNITFTSPAQKVITSDKGQTVTCTAGSGTSSINLVGTAATAGTVVTLTPSDDTCHPPTETGSSGGGGGGGGGAPTPTTPAQPTTTTGQVTATASGGGKTSLTTSENTVAQASLPANSVTSSTEIKIQTETKANVAVNQPAPSGKSMVGGYVYNFTATSGGVAVATFSKDVTLTFTYTDAQIAGLNESSLKVYYWDGSQWLSLTSTVDAANNKVTATTNHFTYFVLMGLPEGGEEPTGMAKPEDYGLTEGDLVRAQGDFDIFIISQYGYKRLFLNPVIFEMYGHLGGWTAVKTITPETRDAFVTSTHYRWAGDPNEKVYHQEVTGEDTATLHWINMTAEDFLAQGGTANGIFTINKSEFDWYPKGADKTSL